jgi:hypothetical protein
MWEDPIVKELHAIRERHAAQFDYDIDAMFRDLQEQEQQSGVTYISFDQLQPKVSAKRTITKRKPRKQRKPVQI